MYKIVLLSRDAEMERMDAAGRCLALLSQASGLGLEIELRDPDEDAERPGLALACLRADAVLAGPASRRSLDERLGLFAEFRRLQPTGRDGGADLLLVRPHGSAEPWSGGEALERLATAAFLAAERRSRRLTWVGPLSGAGAPHGFGSIAGRFPDTAFETLDADAAALLIEARPERFDVILADADVAANLSAAAGAPDGEGAIILVGDRGPFVFAAGETADARSAISAAAMLLLFALDRPDLSTLLRSALDEAVADGPFPEAADLGERVQSHLAERLGARSAHLQLMAMNRGCCG